MTDLIIAIFVTLAIWAATLHDLETQQEIEELKEVNSFLWLEGENTTARHATEQECVQHGNRLVMMNNRYRYFCTNIKEKE